MTQINVLVVDDFPQNLVASEAMLTRPGLNVLKAGSGVEALELLLAHEVALALIDVHMPGMDGFELAELIRGNQRTAGIPIIFMTAAAEEAARIYRGYQAGAVDFLNKPINPDILRGKVEVFVQLHAQKARIREQLEELRQALQVNELFVAVLGHDLRTPLSAVLHGAELLQRLGEDARIRETARRIHSSGARMERMVRQLLDVAQLRSSGVTLYKAPANYCDTCRRIIDEIEHGGSTSRLKLESRGELDGVFDVDRMAQVLSNLIGNALQHSEPQTPVLIELDGERRDRIVVRVANQGVIPPDMLERLFHPFSTAVPKQGRSSGLGLGLYIVKQFVEAHGGTVTVSSDAQSGTRFELMLPRGSAAECTGDPV